MSNPYLFLDVHKFVDGSGDYRQQLKTLYIQYRTIGLGDQIMRVLRISEPGRFGIAVFVDPEYCGNPQIGDKYILRPDQYLLLDTKPGRILTEHYKSVSGSELKQYSTSTQIYYLEAFYEKYKVDQFGKLTKKE